MDPNTPMVFAAAKYANRPEAVAAFETVWGARHRGEFDHTSIAVLAKDAPTSSMRSPPICAPGA
jgi:hypothetical protein